jgi:hypothetical protein
MKKLAILLAIILLIVAILPAQFGRTIQPTLVPHQVLLDIINEASGDLALQNEILIAGVNRNRKPEEYASGYFETAFLIEKLREYGITDARIIDLPTSDPKTWDAESAELWLTKPAKRKIADLKDVPACLCSSSSDVDVTAELVYVGPGFRDSFYEGKDLKGKIALVNGFPGSAQLKRVVFLSAASAVCLAGAGPSETEKIIAEVAGRSSSPPMKSSWAK